MPKRRRSAGFVPTPENKWVRPPLESASRMWGQTYTSIVAATISAEIAMITVTRVAAGELVPLAAAAGDQPGGERQEERGQLDQRVREHAEDQREARDLELVGDRRALEAEVESLGGEEKIVTAQTKRIASWPALTWIQREMPVRCTRRRSASRSRR